MFYSLFCECVFGPYMSFDEAFYAAGGDVEWIKEVEEGSDEHAELEAVAVGQ